MVSPTSFSTSKLEINGRRGTQETFNAVFAPENTTLRCIWVSGYDPEVVSVDWDNASTEIKVTILDGDKGTDIIIENLYAANNRTVVKVNGGGTYDPGYGDDDGNGDNAVDNVYDEASQTFDVYTLQGVCVKRSASQSDINTLSPGIYIIGGKKTVVR